MLRQALIALWLAIPSVVSAQGIIVLRAGSGGRVLPAASAVVAVPVTLDMSHAGGLNVASISATVHWTLPGLSLDSIKAGSFGSLTSNLGGAPSGSATVSIFNATGTTASVTIATLYFTSHTGATTVTIEPTGAGNEAGQPVLGAVRVQSLESCVGVTTLWGDVNADGAVNIVDAQQVARNTVGLGVLNPAELAANGDVNGDGQVTIIDAQQIARFSVGLSASPRVNTLNARSVVVSSLAIRAFIQADFGAEKYGVPRNPLALGTGVQGQLEMLAKDASNTDVTACATLTYSSNSASATVSPTGLVTGVSPGSSTITISAGGSGPTAQLTVLSSTDVNISVSTTLGGTASGGGGYPPGSTVTLVATPAANYVFANWSENGAVVSTNATYTFVANNSRTLLATFTPPPRPVITVTSPLPLDATTGQVFYSATCTFCTRLSVSVEGLGPSQYLGEGSNSVSGNIDLRAADGGAVDFLFTATAAGTYSAVVRTVSVAATSHLMQLGWVNGRVLDADPSRATYVSFAGSTTAGAPFAESTTIGGLGNLATHADIATFGPAPANVLASAFVTPRGAIYASYVFDGSREGNGTYTIGNYGSGGVSRTVNSYPSGNLAVAGNYAVFGGGTGPYSPLYRRDLQTGTDVVVAPYGVPSVAATGAVAYHDGAPDIYLYRNGGTQKIDSTAGGYTTTKAVTDGTNVLYSYRLLADNSVGVSSTKLFDGTNYIVLGKTYSDTILTPGKDYAANNGWVAYTLPDGCQCATRPYGTVQVWERSPAGVTTKTSSLAANGAIRALADDGRIVFDGGGRRYLYTPGGTARDVGSSIGTVVFRNGVFLTILGQTVWQIVP